MFIDILAGATNATLVTLTGYPFDTIKVRMQSNMYPTTLNCIMTTYNRRGIYGFYKGSTMPLLSHMIKRTIQYPVLEELKKRYNPTGKSYSVNYMMGAIQGPLGTMVGNPLQVIKIRTQTNKYSLIANINIIYNDSGLKGFYRGFIPTLIKDTMFGASFIGTYYTLRDIYGSDKWYINFTNGVSAHIVTWSILIPIDYIKTNIQRSKTPISIKEVIINGYNIHGVKGFWKGIVPACVRTVPVSGFSMLGYEMVRNYFKVS